MPMPPTPRWLSALRDISSLRFLRFHPKSATWSFQVSDFVGASIFGSILVSISRVARGSHPMNHQAQQPEQNPDHFLDSAQKADCESHPCRISEHRQNERLAALLADQLGRDQERRTFYEQSNRLDQQRDFNARGLMKQSQQDEDFERAETPGEQIA